MFALATFVVVTFAVSWTLFIAAAALRTGDSGGLAAAAWVVHLAGVFAPAFVALALTAREGGGTAAADLLGRIGKWPAWPLVVFATGYIVVMKLVAAAVHRLSWGAWPAFGEDSMLLMAAGVLVSTPVQAGEEVGWRGYALPRMAQRMGLGPASILLGVIWAAWHLPLFFIPGSEFNKSFPLYTVSVAALSVPMAWLYWRSGGSLLATMIMHAAINNTASIVPSGAPAAGVFTLTSSTFAWTTAAVLWVGAVFFLVRMRSAALT